MLADHLGLAGGEGEPAVAAYRERLQARPAYRAALKAQEAAALRQGVPAIPAPLIRPR